MPADHNCNGEYRVVHVNLATTRNAADYMLSCRRGYYTDSPLTPKADNQVAAAVPPASQ